MLPGAAVTRLDAARAWGRPISAWAAVAAFSALIAGIIAAAFLEKSAVEMGGALVVVATYLREVYRLRGAERIAETQQPQETDE